MSDYSNQVVGFTKLFAGLVHSTVWREEMHVKVVWITMLALADRNGEVLVSMPGLADAARVSIDQCTEALGRLQAPDKHSRTKTSGGRRIKAIDGGWVLLNYLKYRQLRDDISRREQIRDAVRRHRAKKSPVIGVSHVSRSNPIAEAEAEAEQRTFQPSNQSMGDRGMGEGGFGRANPLITGKRPGLEVELLRLVQREAELTDRDGMEIMAEVTSYEGAKRSKLNPATMSDDRLSNSVLDARARVKRLEEKVKRKSQGVAG